MSELLRYADAFGKFHPDLYRAWRALDRIMDFHQAKIGHLPLQFMDSVTPGQSSLHSTPAVTPSAAAFSVVGIDGKFVISIVNPQSIIPQSVAIARSRANHPINSLAAPIVHNLQSATDMNFNNNSSVTDYGSSSQLGYTFQNPNKTLFWRLRSSYDGQTWNQWQIFSSALTCGPVGVQSGLLRTAALTQVNAAGTPTTQPLTSTTGVPVNQATISIASFQVQYPAPIGLVTYNSGSITPLLDSTKYYVYCLDPTYAGGAQTYIASVNNPDVSSLDAVVFLGFITTPAHGGGGTGGSGGGNGPCFIGSTLVITRDGIKPIVRIGKCDEVLTQRGWRKVRARLEHEYCGDLYRMPSTDMVTADHRFYWEHTWVAAKQIFPLVGHYSGKVFNLAIDGDGSDEEQCYTLANGWIAHNVLK